VKKVAEEQWQVLDKSQNNTFPLPPPPGFKPPSSQSVVFRSLAPPNEGATPTQEEYSVTGTYEVVKKALDEAIDLKKGTKDAAERVSAAVGTLGMQQVQAEKH